MYAMLWRNRSILEKKYSENESQSPIFAVTVSCLVLPVYEAIYLQPSNAVEGQCRLQVQYACNFYATDYDERIRIAAYIFLDS
jgi:hypothetical protein